MQGDVEEGGWVALLAAYPYPAGGMFSHTSVVTKEELLGIRCRRRQIGVAVGVVKHHDARRGIVDAKVRPSVIGQGGERGEPWRD